jgi:D-amino peptidase
LSRVSAKSPSLIRIESELREAINKAITKFKENKVQPLKTEEPVKAKVTFNASHFADVAELLPTANRIDGLTVEYSANNIIEAYKIFQLFVHAASGVAGLLERLQ